MSITPNTTFSWNNYTRPTPKNLLNWSRLIQGILIGISTLGTFNQWSVAAVVTVNISIIVISQLTLFFGNIVEETESAIAKFPSGEEITLTKTTFETEPAAKPDNNETIN